MSELPTYDGRPTNEHHEHVGWPVDPSDALQRIRAGLPVYWPTSPSTLDQRAFRAFAAERGPNSE